MMLVLRLTRDVYEIQREITGLQMRLNQAQLQLDRAEAVVLSLQAEGAKDGKPGTPAA